MLPTHGAVLHQGPRQSQGGQAWTYKYEKVDHQLEGHQQVWQILPILASAYYYCQWAIALLGLIIKK